MKSKKTPRISLISLISLKFFKISGIRVIRGVLFFVFLLNCCTLFAQSIKGEIGAGLGGYYRIGKCMPVKVTLENSSSDLSGEISVQISRSTFIQAISLAAPSKKTYVFSLTPPKMFQELEAKLFSGGKFLKSFKAPVHHVSDNEQFVLKSSTLKTASNEAGSSKVKTAYLDPQDFPESWSDYEAVNSIVLDGSDIIRLNVNQRTAIARWTQLGGSAILSNGAQSQPMRNTLGLGSFGGAQNGDATEDISYQPSLLDLDEEVFKALRIQEPIAHSGTIWALGALLLIYALTIVLCLVMARKPGVEKLWIYVAVPAATILFSAFSPLTGLLVNAGNAMVRQYSIHHVFTHSMDEFAAYDLSLIFSRKGNCRVSPAIQSPYLVQNELEKSTAPIRYEFEGNGMPSAALDMNMGSAKLISLSGFSSQSPFLILHNTDSVVLTNKSGYFLRHCTFIQRGVSMQVGDIPPGNEIHLQLNFSVNESATASGRADHTKILTKAIGVYETETLAGSTGDCVICALDNAAPSLKSDDLKLSYKGSSAVIYHLGKNGNEERDLAQR